MVKNRKIKIDKVKTEEQTQVESFIKIIIGVLLCIVIIYIFTKFFVKNEVGSNTRQVTEGTISYDKLIVGNILNQNYDEYYVFVYNGNDNEAIYYSAIIDKYMAEKDANKVFWIDLNNKFNEKYIAGEDEDINLNPQKISELKFGQYTLVKIKNKKIIKYINNIEDAKIELSK